MSDRRASSNYDRLGGTFSQRSWTRSDEVARHLGSVIGKLSPGTWLDVGSGTGDFAQLLSRQSVAIIGLDLSNAMLHGARDMGTHLIPVQGDVHYCPFQANTFDVVACRNVLKHCHDTHLAIAEMQRVCRPSGHILVVESCAINELDRQFMNSVIAVTEPHQNPFLTPWEWVRLLTATGANLVSRQDFTHQVISTPQYRTEQYGLTDEQLLRHWNIFTHAPAQLKVAKHIEQSSTGELRFRLSWTAIVVQVQKATEAALKEP